MDEMDTIKLKQTTLQTLTMMPTPTQVPMLLWLEPSVMSSLMLLGANALNNLNLIITFTLLAKLNFTILLVI